MSTLGKRFAGSLLVFGVLSGSCAWSQGFPSKPIKIVVPFTPGGGNDVFGRTIGQKLWERLGQPVAVENKPGAGSSAADMRKTILAEIAKWSKVVKTAGIEPQ